jgi:endonuclease/exonuclease/phosphatase family metal-dependent hydrolase
LNMPYVFGPTTNPLCGNAIMSRYPILAYSKQDLPSSEPLKQTSFILALIDIGDDERLTIITTELHDRTEQISEVRQLQAETIAAFIRGETSSRGIVLLGAINAHPEDPEIRTLRLASFVDAALIMDRKYTSTFPADNPDQRLDYIWASYDLKPIDVQVPLSTASDHLPVFAVIYR